MKNIIMYLAGVASGVALTILFLFVLNGKDGSSHVEGLTMYDTVGEKMTASSYYIIQTIDDNHALAIGGAEFILGQTVLVIGNADDHFYDGKTIKAPQGTAFYNVGTYQYESREHGWKTSPAVKLYKEQAQPAKRKK